MITTKQSQIRIEKFADGYIFSVYPKNNNHQPMGQSPKAYSTFRECQSAKEFFESYIRKNRLDSEDGHHIRIIKGKKLSSKGDEELPIFQVQYFNENDQCIFESRKLEHKESCKKNIKSVYKAICES